MKKGRFESSASAKKHTKKVVALLLVMLLLVGSVVGTTLAWLTAKSTTVTNTFTMGNISLSLTETGIDGSGKQSFKLVPGETYTKDPTVVVGAGSEACYVFVKIVEDKIDGVVNYTVDDGVWDQLTINDVPVEGVYYTTVPTSDAEQKLNVLDGKTVTISQDITAGTQAATLTFTAYAVQEDNVATVQAAWDIAKDL